VEASTEKRNKRAAACTVLSIPIGFGSWGYFMLAANPNFYFGIILLLLCPMFVVIAIYDYFDSKTVRMLGVVVVVAASCFISRWAWVQWTTKIINDTRDHLELRIDSSPSGDVLNFLILVSNKSSEIIQSSAMSCLIRQVNAGGGRIWASEITTQMDNDLVPGGDTQTAGCNFTNQGVHVFSTEEPVDCVDTTVVFEYMAKSKPNLSIQKKSRFVYGFGGIKIWTQQPISVKGSYCPP
jgi:hypothetical protein